MNKLITNLANRIKRNPKAFYILFYAELCELFGRFGISALLVLYVTHDYQLSDAAAFTLFGSFMALIFATPIIGGFLADRFLGHRLSAIIGALVMTVGDSFLILHNVHFLYYGLAIIAVGYGFLIPTLSALLGQVYDENDGERDKGFTLYYISKNIGALLAPLLCGLIAHYYDYNYAFVLTTLAMLTGAIVLILGYSKLPVASERYRTKHYSTGYAIAAASLVLLIPIIHMILIRQLEGELLAITAAVIVVYLLYVGLKNNNMIRRHLLAIVIFTLVAVVFSAFLGLGSTALNLFIDRIVNRHALGFTIPTPTLFALDPLFMIVLGPVLAGYYLKKKAKLSATRKTGYGMVMFAIGFFIFVMAAKVAMNHGSASMLFIVAAYAIFPLAELSIMPITLSAVTRLAPRYLQAMLVAVYMLGLSTASYLTGRISSLAQVNFDIITKAQRIMVATIYHNLFVSVTIILGVAALLLFLLIPLMKKLQQDTNLRNGNSYNNAIEGMIN